LEKECWITALAKGWTSGKDEASKSKETKTIELSGNPFIF
jgi:hypothetical protein